MKEAPERVITVALETLRRVVDSYVFGFVAVTLVFVLMLRGLIVAGESMHVDHDVILASVVLATLLYGLAVAVTLYIRRK